MNATAEIEIGDDTPLRLEEAARRAFPGGGMTAHGLRKEANKGRLAIERIANKDYTTLGAIKQMREACRVAPKDHGSGSNQPGGTRKAASSKKLSGSSETVQSSEALERARAKVQGLRKRRETPSETTSPPSRRRASATVTQLRSKLPT